MMMMIDSDFPSPLTLRLSDYVRLSREERQKLDHMGRRSIRDVRARCDLVREGEEPRFIYMIVEGIASRYKMLEDGRRQIVAFLVPGDLCDLNIFCLKEMDHSVGAITKVRVAQIDADTMEEVTTQYPHVARAFWWNTLVTMAIQREWTLNLGQRSAFERLAHVMCEFHLRLRGVGMAQGNSCPFPLTQVDLADATGLTPVHVNRTLQEMRRANLIELSGRTLTIPDMDALSRAALFNPNYLHLSKEGWDQNAND